MNSIILLSIKYTFTVYLHYLQCKKIMKNRTVNSVNNNLQFLKKKNIVFQLYSFYYYSIYNVYSENTIHSHTKNLTP